MVVPESQVADDAIDLGVDQFYCAAAVPCFRIGSIVFRQQHELDLLAAQGDTLGVQFFDRHLGAVFHVFAEMGRGAGHRADMADLDDLVFRIGLRRWRPRPMRLLPPAATSCCSSARVSS